MTMLAAAFGWLVIGLMLGSFVGLHWAAWLDARLPMRISTLTERLKELREEVTVERAMRDLIRLQIQEAERLQTQVNVTLRRLECPACRRSAPEVIAEAIRLEREALAAVPDDRCDQCGGYCRGACARRSSAERDESG